MAEPSSLTAEETTARDRDGQDVARGTVLKAHGGTGLRVRGYVHVWGKTGEIVTRSLEGTAGMRPDGRTGTSEHTA